MPKGNLLAYVLVTFSLVVFLFYIDEGNYSLEWATHPIAWVFFSLYFILFLVVLLLIDAFIFPKWHGIEKAALTIWFFLLTIIFIVLLLFFN